MKKSTPTFILKTFILFIFLVPVFVFAQNIAPDLPSDGSDAGDSLLPPKPDSVTTDVPIIEPSPGVNDGNTLVPQDVAPTTQTNTNQGGSTSFTPTSGNSGLPGSAIDTSILNQQMPQFPSIPTQTSDSILDQILNPDELNLTTDNQPLNRLLNQLFYIGLIAAVVLAIVMIIRGGVEYMTIDAITSKESGKKRVQAALGGLLLAFSAILILNTINPGLTSLKLMFTPLNNISSVAIEADMANALAKSTPLTNEQVSEILSSGKIPTNISPTAQKILAQTLAELNKMNTGELDNTLGGYLACAAAVNRVIELATGQPAGGGVSTSLLQEALSKNPKFILVPGGLSASLPGDVVVSPTVEAKSGKHGHAAIVTQAGGAMMASNSSANKTIQENYTAEKWNKRYVSERGLKVYVYRPL